MIHKLFYLNTALIPCSRYLFNRLCLLFIAILVQFCAALSAWSQEPSTSLHYRVIGTVREESGQKAPLAGVNVGHKGLHRKRIHRKRLHR